MKAIAEPRPDLGEDIHFIIFMKIDIEHFILAPALHFRFFLV